MITTEMLSHKDLIELDIKGKLESVYAKSGIPKKYHFAALETSWSTEFSTKGKLTASAKRRSEAVKTIVQGYIQSLDAIVKGDGMRILFKNSTRVVTDMMIDGSKESGKTLLASIIAQEAINRGHSVKFMDWVDYFDRFQTFESREKNNDFFDECLAIDFLFFDSLSDYNAAGNKYFCTQLDRLLAYRSSKGLVTIFCIDSKAGIPVFGPIWNRFTRETFTLPLPETELKNENRSKRT